MTIAFTGLHKPHEQENRHLYTYAKENSNIDMCLSLS